jgi:hypothetical protein
MDYQVVPPVGLQEGWVDMAVEVADIKIFGIVPRRPAHKYFIHLQDLVLGQAPVVLRVGGLLIQAFRLGYQVTLVAVEVV